MGSILPLAMCEPTFTKDGFHYMTDDFDNDGYATVFEKGIAQQGTTTGRLSSRGERVTDRFVVFDEASTYESADDIFKSLPAGKHRIEGNAGTLNLTEEQAQQFAAGFTLNTGTGMLMHPEAVEHMKAVLAESETTERVPVEGYGHPNAENSTALLEVGETITPGHVAYFKNVIEPRVQRWIEDFCEGIEQDGQEVERVYFGFERLLSWQGHGAYKRGACDQVFLLGYLIWIEPLINDDDDNTEIVVKHDIEIDWDTAEIF